MMSAQSARLLFLSCGTFTPSLVSCACLCSRPNRPHYASCPSCLLDCLVRASNSKTKYLNMLTHHVKPRIRCERSERQE